jgi:hypothetical protein
MLLYRGGLVSSAFRPFRRSGVGCSRRRLASLRDRHLGPPMMGLRGCGGPIYRGILAVRVTAGIRIRNGLASSIVPAGTSLHRSAEFAFSSLCLYCAQLAVRYMSVTKCALTARALSFCSVALSGQAPKPHSGAP